MLKIQDVQELNSVFTMIAYHSGNQFSYESLSKESGGTNIAYANWRLNKKEQGEVDIVGIDSARLKPSWAVEVKWSDRYAQHPEDLTSLLTFLSQNDMKEIVASIHRVKCCFTR